MNKHRKEVLVLGGAGFIGYNIIRFLIENRDYYLTVIDDFSAGVADKDFKDMCSDNNVNIISADLTKSEVFEQLNVFYDYVYVLASVVGVNRCIEEPEEVIRINARIILNTTNWLCKSKPERVLFASSSENYAATTDIFNYPVPTNESVPLCIEDTRHPRFTYAVTKIFGEAAFFAYGQALGIHTTIVRYQNIYGPRMGFKHAIPHIIERIYKGENPVKIYGGEQTRAFAYCTDGAEGTVLALESDMSDQQIYHIGNDHEITIDILTRKIGEIMEYKGEYVTAPTYPGSVSRRCPDISKAKKELRYNPQIEISKGLEDTIQWYQSFFDSGKKMHSGGFKAPEALNYKRII
jgi:nucleoside-diphosphate-sugar epimerase